jgi:hypothetical protein
VKYLGTGPADDLDAVTVASVVVKVLTTSLPQPDYVTIDPGSHPSVTFMFSESDSVGARWGHVREWARQHSTTPTRSHYREVFYRKAFRYYSAKFTFSGIEFHVFAPGVEGRGLSRPSRSFVGWWRRNAASSPARAGSSETDLVDDLDALTLASVVVKVLTTSLPQPDYVTIYPPHPPVTFMFSESGSGEARWGRVREWALRYDTTPAPIHGGETYSFEFTFSGFGFKVWAPGREEA